MKIFYIPTSTFNFNNILSSESISPKAFYEKRGFGYSRWATIPENPYNNAIVLYDSLCFFDRPKSDIEDHPLLVEVQLEESELKQKEGFWFTDHTIYLAPTTTRFLFFSETDKNITLSMSENSSETKLMKLYTRRIVHIEKPIEEYKPIATDEPCKLNVLEINKDFRINKMKGLLHGYYIGALLSTDLDSVKFVNALKEVHNIFAAILSSLDRIPTPHQNERLDELFKVINHKSTDYQRLFEIIGDEDKIDKVLALDFVRPRDVVRKTDYLYYLQQDPKDAEKENPAIEWIKERIMVAKNNIKQNSQLLNPDKSEIVVLDNNVSVFGNKNVIDETEKNLCLAWFNKTLSAEDTNGKISTYREQLADKITDEAVENLGDKWKESGIRTYLNALRHHIAGDDFNQEWRNGLLSSIAAVLIAGDDWEKLLAFMQNKEMTDYKMAFGFYGTLNGFANLFRDFTDLLYNQENKYVWEVYKEFYGQLFGKTLLAINKHESDVMQIEKETQTETESDTKQKKEIISSSLHKANTGNGQSRIVHDSSETDVSTGWESKLNTLNWWNNKTTKRNDILNLLTKCGPTEQFISEVTKVSGVGKQKITDLRELLGINKSDVSNDMFSNTVYHDLISPKISQKYPNESKFLLSLDSLKNIPNKAIERLIENFEYTGKGRDKEKHISYFINLCKKEGRGDSQEKTLKNIFSKETAILVEKELRSKYSYYKN